jgi:hypothetical protein
MRGEIQLFSTSEQHSGFELIAARCAQECYAMSREFERCRMRQHRVIHVALLSTTPISLLLGFVAMMSTYVSANT